MRILPNSDLTQVSGGLLPPYEHRAREFNYISKCPSVKEALDSQPFESISHTAEGWTITAGDKTVRIAVIYDETSSYCGPGKIDHLDIQQIT